MDLKWNWQTHALDPEHFAEYTMPSTSDPLQNATSYSLQSAKQSSVCTVLSSVLQAHPPTLGHTIPLTPLQTNSPLITAWSALVDPHAPMTVQNVRTSSAKACPNLPRHQRLTLPLTSIQIFLQRQPHLCQWKSTLWEEVDTKIDENQMLAMWWHAEGHPCTLGCINAMGKTLRLSGINGLWLWYSRWRLG